jgi:hypothetical protein
LRHGDEERATTTAINHRDIEDTEKAHPSEPTPAGAVKRQSKLHLVLENDIPSEPTEAGAVSKTIEAFD